MTLKWKKGDDYHIASGYYRISKAYGKDGHLLGYSAWYKNRRMGTFTVAEYGDARLAYNAAKEVCNDNEEAKR